MTPGQQNARGRSDGVGPAAEARRSVLRIRGLRVAYRVGEASQRAVDGIDLEVAESETLGIVGESGSGKSSLALAIPRLVHLSGGEIVGGSIRLGDAELVNATEHEMRSLRGRSIGMVFQQPLSSLNPVMTIGAQLTEGLRHHLGCSRAEARVRAIDLLREVHLPGAPDALDRYPHELSGGMRQRVVIAMAIACRPKLLVADEPTTALDVTVQSRILDLLRTESERLGLATLFISHDMGVVSAVADRVGVMYAGQLVEIGPIRQVVEAPAHPYTWGLLNAVPRLGMRGRLQPVPGSAPSLGHEFRGCRFFDRCPFGTDKCSTEPPPLIAVSDAQAAACWYAGAFDRKSLAGPPSRRELTGVSQTPHRRRPAIAKDAVLVAVTGLSKHYRVHGMAGVRILRAVDDVDLEIRRGEILGLVGESGCGKSTLARLIIRLIEPTGGRITFNGESLLGLSAARLRQLRPGFQIVFQNPTGALNPRLTVEQIVRAPLRVNGTVPSSGEAAYLRELLELVGLDETYLHRYPHQLSGGQKQRVAIARALALQPELIVCDEAVSSLDVSTRAQVLNLLQDLKEQLGLTYLFISHDIATVQNLCDRIAVMYLGKIVEIGPVGQVLDAPQHPYTRALLSAVPAIDFGKPRARLPDADGEIASPLALPTGCRFRTRCPLATGICEAEEPQLLELGDQRRVACHHAPLRDDAIRG